jgi:hypothetical protein
MTRQKILTTDPYYVDTASTEGRLFLTRTKGSLSGGTRVKLTSSDSEYKLLKVAAKVKVKTQTAPGFKYVDEEVLVTLDDLVIRRMPHHPDMLNTTQHLNRVARRAQKLAERRVLAQLKAKEAKREGT